MTAHAILTAGLQDFGIDCAQGVDNLLRFSDILLEKNKVMNLTAVTDPLEVVSRHYLDCAVMVPYVQGKTVLDVGCGAGFPGIPMALLSDAHVTMLDSLGKRITFLNESIGQLGMENAVAVHARAEEFGHRGEFDVVTSRAVAKLNVLAELCLPMVKLGGCFIAMKAVGSDEEIAQAKHAIYLLGGTVEEVRDYQIPQSDVVRRLCIIRKERGTPKMYPRRFAQISAKPL